MVLVVGGTRPCRRRGRYVFVNPYGLFGDIDEVRDRPVDVRARLAGRVVPPEGLRLFGPDGQAGKRDQRVVWAMLALEPGDAAAGEVAQQRMGGLRYGQPRTPGLLAP
jgi:hypothetical protein